MTLNAIKNTLFIGNVWHHYDSLHSTNDLAAEWLSNNALKSQITEGGLFTTFNQTAGRGQMGNQWIVEPDQNIAFSVVLYPTFLDAREQFHLNKAIALAVHDFFTEIIKQENAALTGGCKIKWSNDIYFYDQKIAGILIQNTLSGSRLQHAIIGIGLNINQLDFPNDFNATSLKREFERSFDLFALVARLAKNIEIRYLQLKKGDFRSLHDEYLSKMYRFGEESWFQYPDGTPFRGTIMGVSSVGRLEVLTTEGVKNFDIKEVKFVI